ncbi:MAG: Ig-like domain-containing protein [Acidobacteria bacterium]|nr:Ig-like domain-containing protein [Acidobacteriota bacterium]
MDRNRQQTHPIPCEGGPAPRGNREDAVVEHPRRVSFVPPAPPLPLPAPSALPPPAPRSAARTSGLSRALRGLLAFALLPGFLGAPVPAQDANPGAVKRYEVAVTAFKLTVTPVSARVPLNVPVRLRTALAFSNPDAPWAAGLAAYARANFRVKGTLYGPGGVVAELTDPDTSDGEEKVYAPGDELVLGPAWFPVAGAYELRDLRLVCAATGKTYLYAEPHRVRIDAGGDLFVWSVTADPMTWQEMEDAGITGDPGAWTGYNFTVGIEVSSSLVEFTFPVVGVPSTLPVGGVSLPGQPVAGGTYHDTIAPVEIELPDVSLPRLPATEVRIPGLIIIPGNIGFLQQHFQVVLVLCNALPPDAGYFLADLTATAGIPDTDGPLVPVPADSQTQPLRAADGGALVGPGASASAQWVVSGAQCGYHEFPIAIAGRLRNASGDLNVAIEGQALAGVAVRPNPKFSLAFTHPDRVERGTEYDVAVQVTNVSTTTDANGFQLNLGPEALSGVELRRVVSTDTTDPVDCDAALGCDPFSAPVSVETLGKGHSFLVVYRFRSLVSGFVTAAGGTVEGDTHLSVGLRFGVSADGNPLNPDTLVLPRSASRLGEPFYGAFLRFLGVCHSLARCPANVEMTAGLSPVDGASVRALALAAAEAGLAVPLNAAPADVPAGVRARLAADLLATAGRDAGVRAALAATPAGSAFREALSAYLGGGALGRHDLAVRLVSEAGSDAGFLLVETTLASAATGGPTLTLTAVDGPLHWVHRDADAPADARFGPGGADGHFRVWAPADGAYAAREYALNLGAGQAARVCALSGAVRVESGGALSPELSGAAVGREAFVPFGLVRLVKATPDLVRGADLYGRTVFALFNRRVRLPAEGAAALFTCPDNEVLLALPLQSGRLVGLAFNRPVGRPSPASPVLTLSSGPLDSHDGGRCTLAAEEILIDDPASGFERGARIVTGRVLYPGGRAVARPVVELWARHRGAGTWQDLRLSRVSGAETGTFAFPFIYDNPGGNHLRVSDPVSGARRRWPLRITVAGEEINPVIVLEGSGTVTGGVLTESGAPVPGLLAVILACRGDGRQLAATLDNGGRFVAENVPVGDVDLTAYLPDGTRVQGYACVRFPGDTADVVLVVGGARVFGRVVETAGGPAAPLAACPVQLASVTGAWRSTLTDGDGNFAFERVPQGRFTLRAIHPASPRTVRQEVDWPNPVPSEGIRVTLPPFTAGVTLQGRVSGARPGEENGVPGVSVQLSCLGEAAAPAFFTTTGGDGAFSFADVSPGWCQASAFDPVTRRSATVRFEVATVDTQAPPLVLPALVTLAGQVFHPGGAAAAGARVSAGGLAAVTDDQGRFAFELPAGGYACHAVKGEEMETVNLLAPAAEARVVLRGQRTVSGQVRLYTGLNGDGEPEYQVVSTVVKLSALELDPGGGPGGGFVFNPVEGLASVMSGADGTFAFTGVWDGPFAVSAGGGALYPAGRVDGVLRGADATGLDLVLDGTASPSALTGRLFLPDGVTPARPGVPVTLTGRGVSREVRTGDGGAFGFSGFLQADRYELEAFDAYTGGRAWQEIVLPPSSVPVTLDLRLLGRNTLELRPVDGLGAPVPDAEVTVTRVGKPAGGREADSPWASDYEGPAEGACYRFEGLLEGSWSVRARMVREGTALHAAGGLTMTGDGAVFQLPLVFTRTVVLRGCVSAEEDNVVTPVPNVEVTLLDGQGEVVAVALTGDAPSNLGEYFIPAAPVGPGRLEARDYASGRRAALDVTISGDDPEETVNLELQDLGSVEGLVTNDPAPHDCENDTDAEMAGAPVTLTVRTAPGSPWPSKTVTSRTDADGRFHFDGIPAGQVTIRAEGTSGFAGEASGELLAVGDLCLVVSLQPTHPLACAVTRADGDPAPYARVRLSKAGLAPRTLTADETGAASFSGVLDGGGYTVEAWTGSGADKVSQVVDVPHPGVLALQLLGTGSVAGVCRDSEGAPLPGFPLNVSVALDGGGARTLPTVYTDAQGNFCLPELPFGQVALRLHDASTGLRGTRELTLDAADPALTGVVVQLEPCYRLIGRVRTEDGSQPVAGAAVCFTVDRGMGEILVRDTSSFPSGDFVLDRLPRAAGTLSVNSGGCRRLLAVQPPAEGEPAKDLGDLWLDCTQPSIKNHFYVSGGCPAGGCPENAVLPGANVEITFTESMDAAWAQANPPAAVLSLGGANVPAALTLSADGKTLTLDPDAPLLSNAHYVWTVNAAFPDLNGHPLLGATSGAFDTATALAVVSTSPANDAEVVGNLDGPVDVTVNFTSSLPPDPGEMTINGTAYPNLPPTDLGSGNYRLSVSHHCPQDGPVAVSCTLTAGGASITHDFQFSWDGFAPIVTFLVPTAPACTRKPELSFSAVDAGKGLATGTLRVYLGEDDRTTEFELVDGAPGNWAWNSVAAEPLNVGTHTLRVVVADNAGHPANVSALFDIDNAPPVLSVTQPDWNATILAATVVFDATVTDHCDLDAATWTATLNGELWPGLALNDGHPHAELAWNDPLLQGENLLELHVCDSVGNCGTVSVPFQVVRTAPLPYTLQDANAYDYRVGRDGTLTLLESLAPDTPPTVAAPVVSREGIDYVLGESDLAQLTLDGREAAVAGEPAGLGLSLRRRCFVGDAAYAARVLDVLENTGAAPVTVDVTESLGLPAALGWSVVGTSSGDASFDPAADRWLTVDDADDLDDALRPNLPALGLLTGGVAGREPVFTAGPGGLTLRWNGVTVPAMQGGVPGRVFLALALAPQPERAAASAALGRLDARPAEFFPGLSQPWHPLCWNTDLAAGPADALPALPALAGGVAGWVADGTPGSHLLAGWRVLMRSASPYYRRGRVSFTDTAGAFAWAPPARPGLPLGDVGFLVLSSGDGCDTVSTVLPPAVNLTEAQPVVSGVALAAADYGAVRVTVQLPDGWRVPGALVVLEEGPCSFEAVTDAVGEALLTGIPPGAFTLRVGGHAIRPVSVASGALVLENVTLAVPYVRVSLTDNYGHPVAGAAVEFHTRAGGQTPAFTTASNENGDACWVSPPLDVDIRALAPRPDGVHGLTPVFRVTGEPVFQSLMLVPGEATTVKVRDLDDQPVAGAGVTLLLEEGWPARLKTWQTGGGGDLTLRLPLGAQFRLEVAYPSEAPLEPMPIYTVSGLDSIRFTPEAGFYAPTVLPVAGDGVTPVPEISGYVSPVLDVGLNYPAYNRNFSSTWDGAAPGPVYLPSGWMFYETCNPECQGGGTKSGVVKVSPGLVAVLPTLVTAVTGQVVPVSGGGANCTIAVLPPSGAWSCPARVLPDLRFQVPGLKPGVPYEFRVTDDAGNVYCGAVPALAGHGSWVSGLELTACAPGAVSGRAFAADGTTPVGGVPVDLERFDGTSWAPVRSAVTAADGSFAIDSVNLAGPGQDRLTVRHPDSQGGSSAFPLSAGATAGLALTTSVTVLRGQAAGGGGAPFASLAVNPQTDAAAVLGAGRFGLSEDGAFHAVALRPGVPYWVSCRDNLSGLHAAVVTLADGQSLAGVELPPVVPSVSGTVRAADGATPVPGVKASLYVQTLGQGSFGWSKDSEQDTAGNGAFAFEGFNAPLGIARVHVEWPLSQGIDEDLSAPVGVLDPAALALDTRISVVTGRVTTLDGQVVTDAHGLTVTSGTPGAGYHRLSLAGGVFSVLGVLPGTGYDLQALDGANEPHCASNVTVPVTGAPVAGCDLPPCDVYPCAGTLYAADGATPAFGLPVGLERETTGGGWEPVGQTTSAPDGSFAFPPVYLPTGVARLTAAHPSSQGGCSDTWPVNGETGLGLELTTRVTVLRATVENAAHEPVATCTTAGATVRDGWGVEVPPGQVRLDAEHLAILGLPCGTGFEVWAEGPGGDCYAAFAGIDDPSGVRAGVRLPPVSRTAVSGTLVAADGATALCEGFTAALERQTEAGRWEPVAWAATDAAGGVSFSPCWFPTGQGRLVVPWPPSQGPGADAVVLDAGACPSVFPTGVSVLTGRACKDGGCGEEAQHLLDLKVVSHDPASRVLSGGEGLWGDQVLVNGGAFTVFGLPEGLRVTLTGRSETTDLAAALDIPAGARVVTGIDLVPAVLAKLQVNLRAADGLTPVSARLGLEAGTVPGSYAFMTWVAPSTDELGPVPGVFLAEDLPAGSYRLQPRRPASQPGVEPPVAVDVSGDTELSLDTGITAVTGQVRQSAGGDPVWGFDLLAVPHDPAAACPAVVKREPDFVLSGLPQGAGFTAWAFDEFNLYAADVSVPPGVPALNGLELLPSPGASVTGVVRAADGASPVPGVVLRLERRLADGTWARAAEDASGPDGAFGLGPVLAPPGGVLRLRAFHPDTGAELGSSELPGSGADGLDLPTAAGVVRGTVVDAGGLPVTAGCLRVDAAVAPSASARPWLGVSADGATVTLVGVPEAVPVDLVVTDAFTGLYGAAVSLGPGQGVLDGVFLGPAPRVAGVVRVRLEDGDGNGVPGWPVVLRPRTGGRETIRYTGGDGWAVFPGVPAGSVEIWSDGTLDGWQVESLLLAVGSVPLAGGTVELTLPLPSAATVLSVRGDGASASAPPAAP